MSDNVQGKWPGKCALKKCSEACGFKSWEIHLKNVGFVASALTWTFSDTAEQRKVEGSGERSHSDRLSCFFFFRLTVNKRIDKESGMWTTKRRGKGWVHWSLSAAFCLLRPLVILWFDPLFGGESLENWGYRNKSSWWSFEIRCGGSIRLNALCDAINSQLKMQLNTHQLQHPRFNSLMIWFNNKPIQNLLAIYMSEGTEIQKERINQSIDQTNVNKPSGEEKRRNTMEWNGMEWNGIDRYKTH